MNRRKFFKLSGLIAAACAVAPSLVLAKPNKETPKSTYHSKKWWKEYFRKETQECKAKTLEEIQTRYQIGKTVYTQMPSCHTDSQIDKLPKSGCYQIFRLQYKNTQKYKDDIPLCEIGITSTPITLKV